MGGTNVHRARLVLAAVLVASALAVTGAQAIDFPVGALQGSVTWDGDPISNPNQRVYLYVPGLLNRQVNEDGSFNLETLQPGTYTFGVYTNHCPGGDNFKLGESQIEVVAGVTTSADIDITPTAGRVVGGITVNGVAVPDFRLEDNFGCGYWPGDGSGVFSSYFPPGPRTANVQTPSGFVGTFSFDVVAGQTTDVGPIDFPVGALQGSVTWDGDPISNPNQRVYLYVPGLLNRQVNEDGSFNLETLQPGTYTFGVYTNHCPGGDNFKLGESQIEVVAGVTTSADIDITPTAGRVVGGITVNGVAVPDFRLEDNFGCGYWPGDGSGVFSSYFPPGPRTANVQTPSGFVGTFSFDVVAGQTTDVGPIDFPVGALQGSVTWDGDPISNPNQRVYLYVPGLLNRQVNEDGSFNLETLQPGTYTFGVYTNHCPGGDNFKLGESQIEVVAGVTTSADIDITPTAGRVVGGITVNGVAVPDFRLEDNFGCGYWPGDGSGVFSSYFPPGPRTANVQTPSGFVGTFSFDVVAGQTTDVDFGTTQVGTDVEVELSGGLATPGGVGLTFDTVTTGGNTIVVESGFGPAPPTGYQIVTLDGDARYWDIDTTAEYDGVITVCIHYDETELTNPASEGSLVLMHDAGSGFEDITTTLDTDANIVCGETTSLSPFAVMEPLVVPNRAPQATDDGYSTNEDVALHVAAPGVLANDQDADLDSLSAAVVTGPTHGSLNLAADGALTYTSSANFNGTDSFTYTATDGTAISEPATVAIAVGAVNDPPTCASVKGDVTTLSPPNHKLQLVKLTGGADVDGDAVTITVTGVTQDEPVNGQGDGDTGPDAVAGPTPSQISLRAERGGSGDGRVYKIAYVVSDGKGGTSAGTWAVSAPKGQGKGSTAVDSGQTVNSFGR